MYVIYPPINNKYKRLLVATVVKGLCSEGYGINCYLIREENK